MARAPSAGLRILIGAGSSADATAALRIIEGLPDLIRAVLGGVFIEEPHTLETGRFPGRRLITKSGTIRLAPTLSEVRTILRAEARAFQRSLRQLKGEQGDDSLFSCREGELVSTAMHAAEGWDVLVIGCQPLHRLRGSIILLGGTAAPGSALRSAAEGLARRFEVRCLSLVVGSGGQEDRSPPGGRRLTFDTLDTAISALARTNALAVLLDLSEGPVRTQADLARVLEAARCPVVVTGTSRSSATLEHSTQIPAPPHEKGPADDS